VASGFCSGGERTIAGCDFTTRPDDDDAGVFPDDAGVLLAIAAQVIGFAGFTISKTTHEMV